MFLISCSLSQFQLFFSRSFSLFCHSSVEISRREFHIWFYTRVFSISVFVFDHGRGSQIFISLRLTIEQTLGFRSVITLMNSWLWRSQEGLVEISSVIHLLYIISSFSWCMLIILTSSLKSRCFILFLNLVMIRSRMCLIVLSQSICHSSALPCTFLLLQNSVFETIDSASQSCELFLKICNTGCVFTDLNFDITFSTAKCLDILSVFWVFYSS